MGPVRQDDQLMQRGANPRTGLVTPFIMIDASKASTGNDYINTKPQHPKRRHRSNGRWKQDNAGWSLTDSPLPSPVAQTEGQMQSRAASVRSIQDRFVVDMPGVDNPYPMQMTNEQIEQYQRSVESVCGTEREKDEIVEPSLSSTRCLPSKISRKEVGSETPREDAFTRRHLQINDKKGPLRAQLLNESTTNPFLGGLANAAIPDQPARLSQYLPRFDLLHPSHFASLPPTYRRPSDILPTGRQKANPRPDTLSAVDSSPSRPKVYRQDGAIKVPKIRVGSRSGESRNKVSQLRPRGGVTQEAAKSADRDGGLEEVRAKLTQTCNCSRCMGLGTRGSNTVAVTSDNPTQRSPSGSKNCQPVYVIPISDETSARPGDKTPSHADKLSRSIPNQSDLELSDGCFVTTSSGANALPNQSDLESLNGCSTSTSGRANTVHRSGTFVRRVQQITTLLDMFPIPYLASAQSRLTEVLHHVIIAFGHALLAVRTLKRADARAEEYLGAVKKLLIAGVYLLVLLKNTVTVVKVTRLMMDILAVVSWPARVVAVVIRWCLLG